MKKPACRHPQARREEKEYGFSSAIYPCRSPNAAAHGCIEVVETCGVCGATRASNRNQGFVEMGFWVAPQK